MLRRITVITLLVFSVCTVYTEAQDLGSIGKENPLSVTGGISVNQIFYGASGIEERRDPYSYFLSGNVTFSLYGWTMPVSFSLSNQNVSFQQPFNQYSLHPTYKWVTGHFGYNSMTFSSYTLNGHVFLGAGVDLAPEGKWKFSGMYGRLLKAVEPDPLDESIIPAFERMGYGFKASYGSEGNFVDVVLFHAEDAVNSISFVPDSLEVLPEENLVASISAGKTIFKSFLLKAELASSAITRDIRTDEMEADEVLGSADFLYTSRTSSSYYKAFKASFDYQLEAYTIGVGYERVDPQYRTLGAYYFNSDLENITLNGGATILEGKMNVAVSGGTQRDNLDKSKISTMRRMVGSFNVNFIPSEKLNLSASYSTFQTYTNIRSQFVDINQLTPYDNLDTLNYTQIARSATATAMYMFGNPKVSRQSINFNLSIQEATDEQASVEQNSGSLFYNLNLAYMLNVAPQNLTLSLALNSNINESPMMNTKTFGPTASLSKMFFEKKLRATVSSSYNNSYTNSKRIGTILNGRISGNYSIQKKHNFSLSLVAVKRESNTETIAKSFAEFTGMLGYSYAFGLKKK